MNAPTPNPISPYDIENRLAELGLTLQAFEKAGREHLAAYFECGGHFPPTFPATNAWANGNRSLRDSLVAKHWLVKNERNQPLVVNEEGTIAITALSGDERTGTHETPSTRSPKGRATQDAVQANNDQIAFEFMHEDPAAIAEAAKEPGRSLWIFLTYRDVKSGELRSELSLPRIMGEDGYIDQWHERIVFPPIPFDTDENPDNQNFGNDNGGQSPEITVQIRKL